MFFHHVKVKQCGSIRNIEALIENYRFYLLVLRIILIVDPRTEFGWQLQVFLLDLHHGFGCGKRRARHDRTLSVRNAGHHGMSRVGRAHPVHRTLHRARRRGHGTLGTTRALGSHSCSHHLLHVPLLLTHPSRGCHAWVGHVGWHGDVWSRSPGGVGAHVGLQVVLGRTRHPVLTRLHARMMHIRRRALVRRHASRLGLGVGMGHVRRHGHCGA